MKDIRSEKTPRKVYHLLLTDHLNKMIGEDKVNY